MQQQVDQLRVAPPVVAQEGIAFQAVGFRQAGQEPLGQADPLGQRHAFAQRAQGLLQLIDAAAAEGRIDHDTQPALRLQGGSEGGKTGIRVLQVMQHAAAVDVVEGAEAKPRQRQERAGLEAHVGQTAGGDARLGDGAGGAGEIEVDHLRLRRTGVLKLLRQHDGGVARAAAGDQRPEGTAEIELALEEIVVDLGQAARRAGDQPRLLVPRIAGRIGIGFVLGGEERIAHGSSTTLPVALRSMSSA